MRPGRSCHHLNVQVKLGERAAVIAASAVAFRGMASKHHVIPRVRGADLGVIPYPDPGPLSHRCCSPSKLFGCNEAGLPIGVNTLPEIRRVVKGSATGDTVNPELPEQIAPA